MKMNSSPKRKRGVINPSLTFRAVIFVCSLNTVWKMDYVV